jgi:hypothetical protein
VLKYVVESGLIFSEKHGLIKSVKCPLHKSWDELQRIDFDTYDDLIQFHKYVERHRYCDACHSNVFNLDGLNEDQIEGACLGNPDICIHATLPHPAIEVEDSGKSHRRCPQGETDLRIIHTARHLTAINDAAKKGYWPLLRPVIPDERIGSKIIVSQNEDGTVQVSNDLRDELGLGDDVYWHNPYNSPLPFAAYLVPPDIEVEERVHIVDLIEDLVGTEWNQGDSWRHRSADAIWTGETFDIWESGALQILG